MIAIKTLKKTPNKMPRIFDRADFNVLKTSLVLEGTLKALTCGGGDGQLESWQGGSVLNSVFSWSSAVWPIARASNPNVTKTRNAVMFLFLVFQRNLKENKKICFTFLYSVLLFHCGIWIVRWGGWAEDLRGRAFVIGGRAPTCRRRNQTRTGNSSCEVWGMRVLYLLRSRIDLEKFNDRVCPLPWH